MRVFVRGSILDTVLSLTLTAQTDPAPAATEEGELPTGIECAIRPVEESSTRRHLRTLRPTPASYPSPRRARTPGSPPPRRSRPRGRRKPSSGGAEQVET